TFGDACLKEALRRARAMGMQPADTLATLTAFTAASIAQAYRQWLPRLPSEVILGGGGTRNATLRRYLAAELPQVQWRVHADFGIPDDAKEAVAFAILGNEAMLGVCANVPGATGGQPALLGQVAFP
ncbi:MAG: anhydro-N-acetylmuramic acid kinase, partial [Armatimonadota bacterium]|nr:anhydro-N-acetylmuramic acid kinase [Armatimonadota bacterium]